MKKYRVSLAMVRTMNYEVRDIEAENKEEAFRLALEAWDNGEGEVDEEGGYGGDDMLHIGGELHESVDPEDFDSIPRGVYIAEVDAEGNENEV